VHVLVTGGAGFIGSHVVDALLADEADVTVVDNFDSFYARQVKERNISGHRTHTRYRLIEADLRDAESLSRRLTDPFDAIIHLAAMGGVQPSVQAPLVYQDVNVRGTHNLLEIAARRRIPHFVFASSSSVYGVNPRVPWREDDFVLQPISPYASTKVSGELLGHVYSHLHGIRFLALRIFTAYGPRQRPDLAIHKFTRLIDSGRPVPVFGDGNTRRDYTYVADIVAGLSAALRYDRSQYEVINLGNNQTVTVIEMIRAIEEAMGMRATIDWQPEQPGDVPQTWASVAKARDLLGYEPRMPFREGIQRFADWYRSASAAASTG
jgi:UDP-glucuronate 4-epimerase